MIDNMVLVTSLCHLKIWASVGIELILSTLFLRLLRIYCYGIIISCKAVDDDERLLGGQVPAHLCTFDMYGKGFPFDSLE